MSTLYAIENAQVSKTNEVLHLMRCGRLNQNFDKPGVRFPVSDSTLCSPLNSNWFESPVYESGFGYAIKRRNVEDFNEIDGLRADNGTGYFQRRLPFLLETDVNITVDLVPYFENSLNVNLKTEDNAYFMHLRFKRVENTIVVQDKESNGSFGNTQTFQGCRLTNGATHTISLTFQKGSTVKIMVDGLELTTFTSAIYPSLVRKFNLWFASDDFAMIRRLEFTKTP
ncbi:hypothetical protein DPMN_175268 [Dreissena polymorpha]|uniref:Galectin n=2 Tax=Dreissena polymorpha TaxID=45954 RepID=A0A9D4E911_DREPO|nr:hypothetical protein DPMN_175268 [Dreissena polymorpha]